MKILFIVCCLGLAWAWIGYPLITVMRGARVRRRQRRGPVSDAVPRLSVVLAVRNAAAGLEARVVNLLEQDYPSELVEVIVACNGCTDGTETVAAELESLHANVRWLVSPAEEGKAGALNRGVAMAGGDVIVFADARQRFDRRALRHLARAFRDPSVGGVTGRLVIGQSDSAVVAGVGSYWQLETQLRLAEARTGSVVGATGAIYAVRRSLFSPLPPAVILDDVYLPLSIVRQGYRITMAGRAVAFDSPSRDYDAEYRRRVRTLVGNLELIRLMPDLLSPWSNPIFGRYVSHKLLRVLTPVMCIGLVVSGFMVPGVMYKAVAGGLVLIYVLGAVGLVAPVRQLALPSAFLLLHTAGITALLRPARGAADVWS